MKHLVIAPDGSKITAPEKSVLGQLSDDHREEIGAAWPSMKDLARRACVSERQCRRILASLEKKGVLQRVPTRRERDGGQTSNEYIFLQLEGPRSPKKAEETRRKLQRTPRSRMTGGGGHVCPGVPVTDDRPPRTPATAAPGHGCPPEESLGESLQISLQESSPLPPKGAGNKSSSVLINGETFGRFRFALRDQLNNALPLGKKIRMPEIVAGVDDYEACFRDWWCSGTESAEDGEQTLLLTEAADPSRTLAGLAKYKTRIEKLMRAHFGAVVQVRVVKAEA